MAPAGLWSTLAPLARTCYQAGNLTLVGGGGGGGGVIAMAADSSTLLSYGGGWGFDFVYASPGGSGQAPVGPSTGNLIGQESEACRLVALAAIGCVDCGNHGSANTLFCNRVQCLPNPFAFYTCFCQCFKAAMVAMPNQAWASNINCQMPQ